MLTDEILLRQWIAQKGLKIKAIAEKMGITPYSLSKKISNETEFKASEIAVFTTDFGMDANTRNSIFFTGM